MKDESLDVDTTKVNWDVVMKDIYLVFKLSYKYDNSCATYHNNTHPNKFQFLNYLIL